jgi:hypothetical protein
MSNWLAISAVTRTLGDLLKKDLNGDYSYLPADFKPDGHVEVTYLPLDKASEAADGQNRVNLFLFQVTPNAAWRNMDMPPQVKPGEAGHPPLALKLHYLLTAYAEQSKELIGQFLLGRAMSILHDYPVLDRAQIEQTLAASGLHQQVERVRLTPQDLSLDELSKLWTGFQTHQRLSAAYEASVVLIESSLAVRAPLPVLRRGREDRGVYGQADLLPPLPTLTDLKLPLHQPSLHFKEVTDPAGAVVVVGDELTLVGHHLLGDEPGLRFTHPRLTGQAADDIAAIVPKPKAVSATQVVVKLSDTAQAYQKFPPGIYRVALTVTQQEEKQAVTRSTNELAFPLAPRITLPAPAVGPDPASPATKILTLNCKPNVWRDQQALLLLGSAQIPARRPQNPPEKTDQLVFDVSGVPAGQYLVRLRVDGVDSLPVADYETVPLSFDPEQIVTIA